MTTILFGMSGSGKGQLLKSTYKDNFKVWSATKRFYDMDEIYFGWNSHPNDAHLAIFRLMTLDLPGFLPDCSLRGGGDVVIERGVTDHIFCVPNRQIPGLESYDSMKIKEMVELESEIIKKRTKCDDIVKILLVMEDKKHIESKVLNGPDSKHRKAIYPDVDTYLEKQKEYVDFTLKYNPDIAVGDAWVIKNARSFIESLGLTYLD